MEKVLEGMLVEILEEVKKEMRQGLLETLRE